MLSNDIPFPYIVVITATCTSGVSTWSARASLKLGFLIAYRPLAMGLGMEAMAARWASKSDSSGREVSRRDWINAETQVKQLGKAEQRQRRHDCVKNTTIAKEYWREFGWIEREECESRPASQVRRVSSFNRRTCARFAHELAYLGERL